MLRTQAVQACALVYILAIEVSIPLFTKIREGDNCPRARSATAKLFADFLPPLSTQLIVNQNEPISAPNSPLTISIIIQVKGEGTMYKLDKKLLHLENPPAATL
jgi:DNA-binding IclR family transcriptional regulator